MTTLTLPQELIDIIISYNDDDKPTLSSCSLVCHAWERPSRALLFRSLHLDATSPKLPTKPHPDIARIYVPDFTALTAQVPDTLLPAVHALTLSGVDFSANKYELEDLDEFYGAYSDDDDVGSSGGAQQTTWTTLRLDELARVLHALPRLRLLTLTRVVLKASDTAAGPLVQLDDLTLADVGTFDADNFLALFSIVGACCITIHAFHKGSALPGLVPPLLGLASVTDAEIHVEEGAEELLNILTGSDVAQIRSLALHATQASELTPLAELLRAAGPALRMLELDLHRVFAATKPWCQLSALAHELLRGGLHFARLKSLEVLTLKLRLCAYDDTVATLASAAALLASLPQASVHTVVLYLDFVWTLVDDLQSISLSGVRAALLKLPLRRLEVHASKRQSEVRAAERPAWERYFWTEFPEWKDILTLDFSRRVDAEDWWDQ